jgi:diguanylate cyclase (GGDEF)-like protein/PAS domain S-box-containing protein
VTLYATSFFLVALLAVSSIQLTYVKQEMKSVLAAQQRAFVARVADEVDLKLKAHLDLIEGRARTVPPGMVADPALLQAWLAERASLQALFNDLFIISASGTVLADFPAQNRQGMDVSDRDYLRATVQTRTAQVSKPFLGRGTKQPVVVFTAPVRDARGEVAAILSGSLNLLAPNFLGGLAQAKVGETGSFAVFTRDRTIVISRDNSRIMTQGPAPGVSPYFDRATAGEEGSEEAVNSRGLHAIFSYSPLQAAPWIVVASLPVDEAYAPIEATQRRILQATLLLGLLVAPLIWLAVRRFYDPLRRALGEQEAGLHRAQALARLSHVITGPDGAFESWPETLPLLIGLDPAKMPESTREWLQLLHPQDRERFRQTCIAAGIRKERADIEYRLRRGGQWIYVRQVLEPLRGPAGATGGLRWFNTIQDVTQQKMVAQELTESQKRLDGIVVSAMDAIVTIGADMRIVLVNPAAERMFGYAAAELLGRPLDFLIPERFRPGHAAHIAAFSGSGVTSRRMGALSPISGLRKNGEEFPIEASISKDESSGRLFLTAILRDITERNRASQALAESERRFSELLSNVQLLSVMITREGKVTYCNDFLLRLTGWQREEVLGRDWFEVFAPDDASRRAETLAPLLAGAPGTMHHENHIVTRAGERRLIHWNNTLLRTESGDVVGTAHIGEDITDRSKAEKRIRHLNRVYAVLSGINTLIVRVRDRDELFREACRVAVEAGRFRLAWIGVVDRPANRVRVLAWHGDGVGQDYFNSMPLELDGPGLAGKVALGGKAIITDDMARDTRIQLRQEAAKLDLHALAILPLAVGGETVGVLALYAGERGFFDEEEMKLLHELAGDLAFSLDHLEKSSRLNYLAYYDVLTGLANRANAHERLSQSIDVARRDKGKLALQVVDLDRFRTVNDSLGREAGDELLRQVAQRMRAAAADPDGLARISADRFAVVRSGVESESELARHSERKLDECFGTPFNIQGTELRIAAKVGIALYPADGADADALFRNAEAALKKAKGTGERVLFYAQEMTERVAEKLTLENKLRQALEREEFVLHYQPKVDIDGRRVRGVEALIRWRSADGLVPPAKFIPLLEETGLIREVGAWALRRAVLDHRHWLRMGIAAPRVAVNVSAYQLRQQDFVDTVREAIAQGANPTGLDMEITESLLMEDLEGNIRKLKAVRDLGLNIAIDDFGTGYSSLGYLAKLPVQMLKIDRSFIVAMLEDPTATTLVQTIISLAHSLRLKVVAEGVETEEQATMLRLLRCNEMQGYLFSKPLPIEEVTPLLRNGLARA